MVLQRVRTETRPGVHRVGLALAAVLSAAVPLAAQEPPEYDPAADRHFLLPSGRVAPAGTVTGGIGGLPWPTAAAPFVTVSPVPRVSVGATTMLSLDFGDWTPVVGSITVQPVRHGPWDAAVTVVAATLAQDFDLDVAATVATVSYGSDARRLTLATGSLGAFPDGLRFAALGFDVEIERGEGSIDDVAGEERTVRWRTKAIGELYAPLERGFEGVVGLLGFRYTNGGQWINLGMPIALDPNGGVAAWFPIVSVGAAF